MARTSRAAAPRRYDEPRTAAPRRYDEPHAGLDPAKAEMVAEVLKAVAHPLRLRVVALLCEGEQHVNALADRLGVRQAILSQQLRILRMRRLVAVTRVGGFARYRLAEPRLRELVSCMDRCSLS